MLSRAGYTWLLSRGKKGSNKTKQGQTGIQQGVTVGKHSCTNGFENEKSESVKKKQKKKRRINFLLVPLNWTACLSTAVCCSAEVWSEPHLSAEIRIHHVFQTSALPGPEKLQSSWRLLSPEFLTSDTFHAGISNSEFLYCCIWEDHRAATVVQLFLFKHPLPGCQLFFLQHLSCSCV